ncbi:MAG: hypothetical protein HC796_10135 [Synechococcaceae cyanobacterium RL_1_2]|nr:hypothetical protein [Synechococcaceae cyanobacterium RL_1_2]
MSLDLVSDSYFLEHLPIPTAIIDLSNGAIIKHNGSLMDLLSLSVGAIEKGYYAARDIFGSVAWEILGQYLNQKAYLKNYEIPVYNTAGEQLCCIVSFNVLEDDRPDRLNQIAADRLAVCVFQDISQQHKLNDHLYHNLIGDLKRYRQVVKTKELLQETLDTIAEAQDFGDMLQRAIIKICETTGWDFVEVWHAPHDQRQLECHPAWYMGHHHDLPELYLKNLGRKARILPFPLWWESPVKSGLRGR